MKKFIFCVIFFTSFLSFAQEKITISGTLKSETNGETLTGATVLLKGTNLGVSTNEYGFYSLTVPKGNYTLIISYLGFTTVEKEVSLNSNLKLNFELQEDTSQLDEVVINSEGLKKTNIRTPQMSVTKLSTKTIKQIPAVMGEVDIIKSIQLLPGVTNSGEGASGFNVRGGAEDQNLVLLDEAIIYNSSHLFGFFSVFNSDAIKDIKLYKGGIPAQFGGRVSSVLDIRQKEGNSKRFALTGGIGAISSRLTAEGPTFKDKGSFLLSGRASYAHLFLKLANNSNSASFYDLNFKTNYKIDNKNRMFLSGYLGQDDFSLAKRFSNSYGNISGNLRWNHIFNDKLFSNLSVIYSRYNYALKLDMQGLDWKSNINNYNLKYDVGYYASDKMKFNFGLSGIYYQFNPGELNPLNEASGINSRKLDDKSAFEGGVYASLEHKITDKLTTMYGLRYSTFYRLGAQTLNEYQNDLPVVYNSELGIYERAEAIGETNYSSGKAIASFGNFEPRFALSYQLNNKSSLKASYNRTAQYLHLISNTTSATPLDVWAPSGKFLKPQLADQYALGYFRNFKNNMYSIETEVYYKTVNNRVDYIDGADLIAQNNIEREILIGEMRSYGLEVLLRKNQGNFTGWLSYTLSKAQQRAPGNASGGLGINNGNWYNTAYDRTHDVSFTGNYKLNEKWSFGSNFIFQTGRPVTYPNGQFNYQGLSIPTYSERNASRLPAYHRLDVSATLTPRKNKNRKWKGEWVFSIYNIYNRNNAASISFGQNATTGANEATQTTIFGIIPSVSYNFKF
ncbi:MULTISPECIES: TonB-dependent receptor [unclassified Tenacibaculum]|uniref:TonB-dependent receptor n=1 Tax=unclassified Tenacibaculum TaxID=2635139 RepID=UPI001F191516|nr:MULTISPECIES: TonB-dependent receptor [unclassified Tenacibaculum]MCF2876362.1 TonB-dependent receptor [Tenacibaculum sp. Cn5-1]MCF2936495.1 TonB-dependent receptor [Tenacibaculum sp. Cn5-34]MCG7512780.1 TonB-dependent receptor [Tenacibaculum sp. Cn5-46]